MYNTFITRSNESVPIALTLRRPPRHDPTHPLLEIRPRRLRQKQPGGDAAVSLPGIESRLSLLEVQVEPTLPGSTHDIALLCTFSDRAALDAYQFNPRHLSLRAEIAYQLRDRVCADVELPG